MEKLGSYITNLMLTVRDSEEKHFIRELALNELLLWVAASLYSVDHGEIKAPVVGSRTAPAVF